MRRKVLIFTIVFMITRNLTYANSSNSEKLENSIEIESPTDSLKPTERSTKIIPTVISSNASTPSTIVTEATTSSTTERTSTKPASEINNSTFLSTTIISTTTTTVQENISETSKSTTVEFNFEKGESETASENITTQDTSTESTTQVTTTEKPFKDCSLNNATHEINDETNVLTLLWETNGSEMCDTAFVNIELTNKNCIEKCPEGCSCDQKLQLKANNLKYKFSESLIPCATYTYQIQINNSLTIFPISNSFDAYRKYVEIENLTITDEEEIRNDSKILNMVIAWDYKNVECIETFVVSARGQGNNFESSIQGYGHKFLNLEACEEFNVNIEIRNRSDINAEAVHTMKRINPSEIQDLSLSQEEDKTFIKIEWIAPKYGAKCIDRYFIHVKNDYDGEQPTRNTTSTLYLLSDVIACVNYTITVGISNSTIDNENSATTLTSTTSTARTTAFYSSISLDYENISESTKIGSIKTEPRPFNPTQQLQLNKQTDKTLSFNVTPSYETRNRCPIVKYHVQCTSNQIENKTMSGSSTTSLVEVEKLDPFHSYACRASIENQNKDKSVWSYAVNFTTKEGVPNPPSIEVFQGSENSTSFSIKWKEPTDPKGIIIQYHVYIKFVKFNYNNPSYCAEEVPGEDRTLLVETLSSLSFTFIKGVPRATYSIQIRASNQASDGEFSSSKSADTKAGPPDELQNFIVHKNEITLGETYNKTIYIDFNYPCRANGVIDKFVIEFKSSKNIFNETIYYDPHFNGSEEEKYKYRLKIDKLEPDTLYTIYGYAIGEGNIKGDVKSVELELNAGIPVPNNDLEVSSEASTTSVHVTIPEGLFDSKVGRITNAKIFIHQWGCPNKLETEGNFTENEPEAIFYGEAMENDCIPEYDTGLIIENGKEKPQGIAIGTEAYCEPDSLCNGKLKPGTTYGFTFRIYTETGYADYEYFKIHTNKEVPIVLISIVILSILCLVFLVGFYISCRRTQALRKSALDSPYDRKDISVQNFLSYHIVMSRSDNEKIKEEYKAIQYFSDTLDRTYIASRANEKLNRYINIYPYDSTRVVLSEDELENDYINASYINGYYYPKEYIAAQGPKPDTVLDFWRMVVQHQTESIVMLTSLVENNKVKCHEYFPRLDGCLTSGNIKIKCVKEQNFPSYIKRVLIVEKNDLKFNVNHYYFCKWPDHGCPSNALDLIEFVKIVRNERQKPRDTFIVHCSAGVGRTGTFIAVDIMIQRIKKEAKINIFDLVKQLRSQRMKMVQSCDQYVFLYTAALELINTARRANVFQNLRDTVLKFVNELEIPESWKRRDNPPNELANIVTRDEKETVM